VARAFATANAPSTPAAVPIALGDGGQAESSGPRNECPVRWLCDLRRHCGVTQKPCGAALVADHSGRICLAQSSVNGEQVIPQPGGFYGGWTTS
jgi:hypothetical protein